MRGQRAGAAVTLVGIAGDSGAGKSTYAAALKEMLGPERVTSISLDDYHSLDRRERAAIGATALHPWKANNLGLVVEHMWALKRGHPIIKPTYDHSSGTLGPPEEVRPRDIVIFEGLHTLYLERMREALDLRMYLDTEPALRARWKVRRDAEMRGYTPEEVLAEIERRRPDVERYIEPQKAYADILIHYLTDPERTRGNGDGDPVRVHFAERLRGSKRRLVKWIAMAGRLGLLRAEPFDHDPSGAVELEVVALSGATNREGLATLLEMVSESYPVKDFAPAHPEHVTYDPVAVSRVVVATMIADLASRSQGAMPEEAPVSSAVGWPD
jgi:phosphoribulokinase